MRVRMLTTAAGPDGVLLAGEVWTLDDDQAMPLVRGGYAAAILTASETLSVGLAPAGGPAVTASVEPGLEQAVLPRARRSPTVARRG